MNKIPEKNINKKWVVITMMIGTLMVALDTSIVNIAIPQMLTFFGCKVAEIELVVSSYIIGLLTIMPLCQWLKDRVGYYRLYQVSLSIFLLGSLLCAVSTSIPMLVLSRVIQAIGGGSISPITMSILAEIFEPYERGKVMGFWGLGVVAGPAMGPTLGGFLIELFNWQSIFLINIPVGTIGLFFAMKFIKPLEQGKEVIKSKFDFFGFTFFIIFINSFFCIFKNAQSIGEVFSLKSFLFLLLTIFSFIVFVFTEKRVDKPMLDLSLFKIKTFNLCLSVTFFRTMALYGGMFMLPIFLTHTMGYSESKAGMFLFPGTAFVAVMMPISGHWVDKYDPKLISIVGLVLLAIATYLFHEFNPESTQLSILLAMSLRGISLGLLVTPLMVMILNSVPTPKVPTASSINSLFQQTGGAVGISLFAILFQSVKDQHILLEGGKGTLETQAISFTFYVAIFLVLIAIPPCFFMKHTKHHYKDNK
ncbi:MAG: EmrB/QacA subfamily drug resistance transporter [Bacteriovoracaceae bacterium]|jgi:EmrB/QacA subfamily drug resistance transporter